jgi:adenylate cyclase
VYQAALREFEQALQIDPRSIDARLGIARVLMSIVGDGFSNPVQQDLARVEQCSVKFSSAIRTGR